MSDRIKIGVVILSYKNIEDTVECINSVKACNHHDYHTEIILVDNSETDFFLNQILMQCEPDITMLTKNEGYSAGNNAGMKIALDHKCDYIIVINNDTIVEPNFIDGLIDVFKEHKNVGLVAPLIYRFIDKKIWSSGGKFNPILCKYSMINNPLFETKQMQFINGCCFCIEASTLQNVGFMDERYFMYSEDTEYSIRLTNRGYVHYVTPNSIIYHKVSISSKAGSPFQLYYLYRNKIILSRDSFRGMQRIYAVFINTIQALYRAIMLSIKGKLEEAKAVLFAIWDSKGKTGRTRY